MPITTVVQRTSPFGLVGQFDDEDEPDEVRGEAGRLARTPGVRRRRGTRVEAERRLGPRGAAKPVASQFFYHAFFPSLKGLLGA